MTSSPLIRCARRVFQWMENRGVPAALRANWRDLPDDAELSPEWRERLSRDRIEIVPWLARTHPLAGIRMLEVGAGEGVSAVALAEQGVNLVGIDIDAGALERGRRLLARANLNAELREQNAAELATLNGEGFGWILFWASLEHMTVPERLAALEAAWGMLPPGGLMTIVETPNRLWPHDSHTSQLPFYSWLPDDLAFRCAPYSPRTSFGGDTYADQET